jgi:hypothetical protein
MNLRTTKVKRRKKRVRRIAPMRISRMLWRSSPSLTRPPRLWLSLHDEFVTRNRSLAMIFIVF